jgi:SH3-like domain-containing protein
MRAWAAPDPSQDPVTRLAQGTELLVLERRGAWAHVQASNGWTGWVDDRRLVETPRFEGTHVAPAAGLQLWAQPDPATAPIGTIAAGTPLIVHERRGAWAQVTTEDGRSGWVDGRLLQDPVAAPAYAQPPPTQPQPQYQAAAAADTTQVMDTGAAAPKQGIAFRSRRVVSLIGGLVVMASAVVPWTRGGADNNAFDVPVQFLIDYQNTNDGVNLAVALLIVGIIGVVYAFTPTPTWLVRVAGLIAILVALAYVGQFVRLLDDAGLMDDVLDLTGFAPIVTMIGGGLMLSGR